MAVTDAGTGTLRPDDTILVSLSWIGSNVQSRPMPAIALSPTTDTKIPSTIRQSTGNIQSP